MAKAVAVLRFEDRVWGFLMQGRSVELASARLLKRTSNQPPKAICACEMDVDDSSAQAAFMRVQFSLLHGLPELHQPA